MKDIFEYLPLDNLNALNKLRIVVGLIFIFSTLSFILVFINFLIVFILIIFTYLLILILTIKLFKIKKL